MSRVLAVVIGCVLIWAGVAKAADPLSAVRALRAIPGMEALSTSAPWIIVASVASIESALGCALLWTRRRSLVASVGVLLLIYTCFLVWLLMVRRGVGCGCMGFHAGTPTRTNLAGLVRNAGLIGLCAHLLVEPRAATPGEKGSRGMRGGPKGALAGAPSARAFTLLELMLVIVIVAVIISLVVPQLARARDKANLACTHRTLQQLAVAVFAYSDDFCETSPYAATPGAPWRGASINGRRVQGGYFGQARYYANLLTPTWYLDARTITLPSKRDLPRRDYPIFECSFLLSQTAFAAPAYWLDGSPTADLTQYRATRVSEAVFPSAKALLLHSLSGLYGTGSDRDPSVIDVAMFDGSAGRRRMILGVTDHTVDRPYGYAPMPTMGTLYGLAGRDF
ncbi:MAG: prepilin-type N-terminal cleavage/methylation domain-containing protein [Phycisphaerales bacterium]|nr:prepilin-type N-terminal cleavage/methylation domain-containing protein [Phycisphaerales bacterium]